MANPKIQVDLTADAKGLRKGAKEAGADLDKLGDKADDAGEKAEKAGKKLDNIVSEQAKNRLGGLGDVADMLGVDLDGVGTKGLVAGAAVAAMGAFAADGVRKLDELVDSTREYKDAANLGWEEASKLGGAFADMGIAAEDGADVVKTLAEEAGDAPEKFKQFGVEIARTSSGAVDMTATLKNVAERFKTMQDPAQRAAMGAALFGDTWLRIAPLLERGSDGVQELIDGVDESRIVTTDTAKAQQDYKKGMRELSQAVGELQLALAKDLVPKLAEGASGLARFIEWANKTEDALIDLGRINREPHHLEEFLLNEAEAMARLALAAKPATDATKALADAEQQAADKAQILKRHQDDATAAAQEAAKATEEQRRQLDLLNSTVTTVVGTQLAYDGAVMSTRDSAAQLTAAAEELNTAINTNGVESTEAQTAQAAYDRQLLSTMQAADSQAKAAADLAKKTAEAAGQTFTAEQYNIVYRDSLTKVRDAANDPGLRSGLDGLIGQVDGTAAAAGRAQANLDAAEAAARRLAAVAAGIGTTSSGQIVGSADRLEGTISGRATGGAVFDGQAYRVHQDEVFVPSSNGRVLSPAQAQQALAGMGTGAFGPQGQSVTINVHSPIGRPQDVVKWMNEELRRFQRSYS